MFILRKHVCLQIDRRISAFIERKQAEINENNVREFCNVIDCNQGNHLDINFHKILSTIFTFALMSHVFPE